MIITFIGGSGFWKKMGLEVGEGWELNRINFASIIFNLLQIWDVHVCIIRMYCAITVQYTSPCSIPFRAVLFNVEVCRF